MTDDKNEYAQRAWLECEPYIRRLCEFKLKSRPDRVDDCVSEVFLDYALALENGKNIENPKAWLTRVAANKIKDIYSQSRREAARITSLEEQTEESAYTKDVFDEAFYISDEKLHEFKGRILSLLTESERKLLSDRYSLKKSVSQIASECATSENNIYQRLFRLRIKTKMLIDKVLTESES